MNLLICPQKQLQEKTDLLFISIQSISLNHDNQLKYQQYKFNKNRTCNNTYETTFNFIYKMNQFIVQLHLQETAIKILQGYRNNSIITLQYLRKYKYLYQKTQHYYKITSHNNNIHIEKLALMNLYIINQIYHFGFYFLFKYLYSYQDI